MLIKKKLVLVLAVAATQAFFLAWGVLLFGSWLESSIRTTVQQQVLAENVETAKQMALLIREMKLGNPRQDEAAWHKLQSVVRGINLPNEGFVCLTGASDGKIICHPQLPGRPAFDSSEPVINEFGKERAPLAVNNDVEGKIEDTKYGLQVVAAMTLPEFDAKLQVHQMGSGIDAAVARVVDPVRPIGLAVSLGLVAVTTIAVTGVVRRYENRLAAINEHLEELVRQRTRALMKTRNGLIFGLAKLAESRDTDTGEHLDRIAKYVTILAGQLREDGFAFSDADIEQLALASSLHDIGKVGVPDAVLLKPGRLDPDERKIIETHATIGGDCLQALSEKLGEDDFLQVAEEIAYGHHEKWDGTGYPFRRAGEQIPLSARIVAVADVYDALRSKRPYKEGMPHEKAKGILLKDAGSHFDPVVIEAFLAAEEAFRGVQPEAEVAPVEETGEPVAV